jgi:hypothetical protein
MPPTPRIRSAVLSVLMDREVTLSTAPHFVRSSDPHFVRVIVLVQGLMDGTKVDEDQMIHHLVSDLR